MLDNEVLQAADLSPFEQLRLLPIAQVLAEFTIDELVAELGLQKTLELLDIPECRHCPQVIDCNCEGPCELPVHLAPPCKHLRSHVWDDDDFSYADWIALIDEAKLRAYQEPRPPKKPLDVLARAARVAVLAARRRANQGLRHPGDLKGQESVVDVVGRLLGATRNWRPVQLGLVTLTQDARNADDEEEEVDPAAKMAEAWEEELAILQRRGRILNWQPPKPEVRGQKSGVSR
jgi:hypothetical protein